MDEKERDAYICMRAEELHALLLENFFKDPALTDEPIARARAIRDEIESFGFYVAWEAHIDPPEIIITIYKKREGLSPKLQEIYNDWFLKTVGITPPKQEEH